MNLQEHYEKRRELDLLEEYDNSRKQLIRLAVLKVVALAGGKAEPSATGLVVEALEELIHKCHSYELTINKLKQDWNTKEKLSESRIEKLKDDLAKLRQQLKDKPAAKASYGGAGFLSRPSSLGSKSFLSPTASSRSRAGPIRTGGDRRSNLFSPLIPRQAPGEKRGRYMTASTFRQLNEAQSGPGHQAQTPKMNVNTKLQLNRAMANKVSPTKSPSRLSFIENFDKSDPSDRSKSLSPDFTPSKSAPPSNILPESLSQNQTQSQTQEKPVDSTPNTPNDGPDANSTAINDDPSGGLVSRGSISEPSSSGTEDIFASANSSMANSSVVSKGSQERAKSKSKGKLLNLAGSSLKGNGNRTISRALSVEHDEVNALDYYKDTNFTDLNDESPNFKRHQTMDERTFDRKKKKVFKVT